MIIDLHQVKNFLTHYFKASRGGHGVHSPFAYALCEEVFYNKNVFYDFDRFGKVREELMKDEKELKIEDFGAGSRKLNTDKRKVSEIAAHGISSKKQSELLYRLINYLNPKTIVELGTSLGLNALYLAGAGKRSDVFSIEGSHELAGFARELLRKQKLSCEIIEGKFDDKFPELLNRIDSLDFLYVDGNHTYEATLKYFKTALQKKNNDGVFIFDDIYWSREMTKAWEEIKKDPAVTMSIDTFHLGFVFFRQEIREKVDLRFYI
jgi:predicted O-methyltransferase YrrM